MTTWRDILRDIASRLTPWTWLILLIGLIDLVILVIVIRGMLCC